MQSAYSAFADLYDSFVQTEVDIPFFLAEAENVDGEIFELMAGTGRVSLPLVKAGAKLTCVDNAPEMLDILRNKLLDNGLTADVRLMDVRELALERRFPLVIIPFHAFPEVTSPDDQLRVLQRIYAHLTDDGRFICTLHNPAVRRRAADDQLHLIADRHHPDSGNRLLVWAHQHYDVATRVVSVKEFFEQYDAAGILDSKRFTEIRFHLLEKPEFEAMYNRAGFELVSLYGDYARSAFDEERSPFMIWTLKR
jgi:SAM-dependent methyltransferase